MFVSVCLLDPVSSSLAQSVMSMASSHSQHSHISTDTMSSMSGSYLAGAEGEPQGDEGGDMEGEENQDAVMESRGPSQQEGVRMEGWKEEKITSWWCNLITELSPSEFSFLIQEISKEPKEQNYSMAVEEQDSEVTVTHTRTVWSMLIFSIKCY